MTFQFQAEGFWKALLWLVTVKGKVLAEVPPGLSTLPKETLAVGWNGGLPPRNTESLTPRRVKKRPAPVRMTVFGVERVGDADARLEVMPLDVGEVLVGAAEQVA